MIRFSEITDTDLKYAALNDKISQNATAVNLDNNSTLSFDDMYDISYKWGKENTKAVLDSIEKDVGRELTDDEIIDIYDLLDTSGYLGDAIRKLNSNEEWDNTINGHSLRVYDMEKEALKCISMAVSAGFLKELHDRAIGKLERLGLSYLKSCSQHTIVEVYNEIMEERYGKGEEKPEDDIPEPEEEPLSKEDQLKLEDFEDIYND